MNTNHDEETTLPAAGTHAAMSLRQQSNTDRSSDYERYQESFMKKDHGTERGEGHSVENVTITFPFGLWWLGALFGPVGAPPPRVRAGARF